jgi:DNA-binding transcriptional LysR family regulator
MASKLSFRHIETIHAIVLTGSVTGAATRLHVTQPAISNVLRDAEERLGYRLFDRRGGRLLPTAVADLLFEEIERSFTGLDAINVFCEQIGQGQSTRVVVACTPAFGATVFPTVATAHRQQHSRVFFSVHSRDAHHVAAMVSARKADIGFGLDVPAIPGVESEVIAELPLHCYLPASHPLASESTLSAAQLQNEPMISLSRMEGIEAIVTRAFRNASQMPMAVAECPAAISACGMVAAGMGFMLFDLLPRRLFSAADIVVRPFEPEQRLIYRAYWCKTSTTSFDPAPLVQLARDAIVGMTALSTAHLAAIEPHSGKAR